MKHGSAEQFDTFADDLLAERSARPLVIIGAARVDDLLAEILRALLLPKRAKHQDELLEGDNPLSTFSARIKACYRLGLIDSTLYAAIDRLRILRNVSAHSVSFDAAQSPVREYIAELRRSLVDRRSYGLTRRRYFNENSSDPTTELQCLLLTLCVLLEAVRSSISCTRGHKVALRITAK